jgi:hypothetical protein
MHHEREAKGNDDDNNHLQSLLVFICFSHEFRDYQKGTHNKELIKKSSSAFDLSPIITSAHVTNTVYNKQQEDFWR